MGEAPGVTAQRNEHITDPGNGELDMLFLFEHVDFDCEGTKWKPLPLDLPKFKSIMAGYQTAVQNAGWASLFTGNHDQPRVVSRWGGDSAEEVPRPFGQGTWPDAAHAPRHPVHLSG